MTTINPADIHFGLDTFGDVHNNDPIQSLKDVVEQAKLADEVGIYAFNLGEHHRDDFAISSPHTVLANIAAVTTQIKLGTAVVVLSSDDPVRVYEQFSTIHALSDGRAELTVGRGSFIESFPLFGYDLSDYEPLFEEKLEMLVNLWKNRPFDWNGKLTQSLTHQHLFPPMDAETLPIFVAVGGSPQSVVRAARHDVGLRLAIIGGQPERFAPFADLYRNAQEQFGHTTPRSIGFHSPGLVADTDEEAIEAFKAEHMAHNARVGAERGWPAMTEARFASELTNGALFVGSVETVSQKLAKAIKVLGADTFDLKIGTGSHSAQMKSIELYGTQVVPRVRELLAEN
ncbi:putative LLM family oxidoreductase [Arcanobacterium wilhelmae]|uniref:LLM family oxidoreductase n=1 Tax=Arcanobacterium wilhelmae TaxID=1803177 RepID=A0ABT9N9I8_9ACTO|nr:LLM class flavin-dependent oxidoreductase [Arcanobacterium wilhelmae]MDP9800368.1 putative LLM family oxidoreductase [Arcanobacterium wilhelmae]WFN89799.1 LLM class flavin-dependent oxidoreductase [Arcanobacterium wilhelmae]